MYRLPATGSSASQTEVGRPGAESSSPTKGAQAAASKRGVLDIGLAPEPRTPVYAEPQAATQMSPTETAVYSELDLTTMEAPQALLDVSTNSETKARRVVKRRMKGRMAPRASDSSGCEDVLHLLVAGLQDGDIQVAGLQGADPGTTPAELESSNAIDMLPPSKKKYRAKRVNSKNKLRVSIEMEE